ncbi:MAG: sucrase ferredoxin [Timaviella obliquedivisa GSE-PSE-MK23-08B]|nr:sucrase ferredoxin [Timaviella obliquedivisa GSE-PSE-MK23-08B]
MSPNQALTTCRFCSVVSKSNHEDPIGTGATYDRFLLIELPQPWSPAIWIEPGTLPQPVIDVFQTAWNQDINFRPLAIAPDRDYTQPNATRVIYYQRPAKQFAQYTKQEFILPFTELAPLINALLTQPDQLPNFTSYQQNTNHIRDLLICTHSNYDVACGRFGYPIYEKLRKEYAMRHSSSLQVWRCSHFGGHQFAPTLLDLPEGRYWGHLEPEILDLLVHRNGSVAGLRSFYRGWAGLGWAEQIAEREIWMQEGWDWLNYLKHSETLAIDPSDADYPNWAEVRINFTSPDGTRSGAYTARVEACGQVTTMWNSGDEKSLETVKQYQVSRLDQVISP